MAQLVQFAGSDSGFDKRSDVVENFCGQAPSDYPEFAEFLVKEGIDSMSLNPDSVMKITLRVLEMEQKIKWNGTQSKQSNREMPEGGQNKD